MTKTTEALAREAGMRHGLEYDQNETDWWEGTSAELARFEALVRADERAKAAQLCDARADEHLYGPWWNSTRGLEAQGCAAAIRSSKPQEG